ncbi:RepB family plasmid replication initiator protein [Mesorhizobium sp. M1409]|uniref:RepB family plasmid replication initiator protein n=1 Tax=unclassified Mesorhizobium TaxID=325217 RepID=UPI003339ED8A
MQIIRKKGRVRGSERKGVRSKGNLLKQATCEKAKLTEAPPEFDEPRTMIETMRIEGADCLTAQDTALYKLMLANARDCGIAQEWHVLGIDKMARFLDADTDRTVRQSRVRESIKRLERTRVTYDFRTERARIDGSMPLILAQHEQDLLTGTALVRYSIPAPVRAAILDAYDYTMLSLNAFARFTSRYAGRLYPRFAYRSSRPDAASKRWEVSPAALAESLSYPMADGHLHLGSFMARAVKPALADIAREEDDIGFKVSMSEPVLGEGRGCRVERLVFLISPVKKRQATTQAARLTPREMDVISRGDVTLEPHELPSTLVIGRAVTSTGLDAITLSEGWRAVYERAKANPKGEAMSGLEAWVLISVVERSGVGAGFSMWSEMAAEQGSVPTHRLPAVAKPVQAPVPVPAPTAGTGMSRGLLEAVRQRPTEEGRLARAREIAANGAQDILDALRGFYPGGASSVATSRMAISRSTATIRFRRGCPWNRTSRGSARWLPRLGSCARQKAQHRKPR